MYMLCKKNIFILYILFSSGRDILLFVVVFRFYVFEHVLFYIRHESFILSDVRIFFVGWKLLIFFVGVIAQTLNVGYLKGGFYGTLVDDVWNFLFFFIVVLLGNFQIFLFVHMVKNLVFTWEYFRKSLTWIWLSRDC